MNYVKQVAAENGIDYNDLVEYAQRVEDAEKMQKSVQFWTDYTQKDDRAMNAANWASVSMNVIGSVTGGISNAMQSARNVLSGEYRPINKNTVWHYGTNVKEAIRDTSGDIVEDRWGGGVGGKMARMIYDQSMEMMDAALGWGIKQLAVGSGLISGNTKTFLEDLEDVVDFVKNSKELMQTYQDALEEGASAEAAFGKCVAQLASQGVWGLAEKKLEDAFLQGFWDTNDSTTVRPGERLAMVVYQPPEQDDFLIGFHEDVQNSGKADFYVSPSGEVIPGEYESYIGENQRDQILSQIEDQTLRSVVGQMYSKDSVIGTGSVAELISFSDAAGLQVVSRSKYRRAGNASRYANKMLRNGYLSTPDQTVMAEIMRVWNNV